MSKESTLADGRCFHVPSTSYLNKRVLQLYLFLCLNQFPQDHGKYPVSGPLVQGGHYSLNPPYFQNMPLLLMLKYLYMARLPNDISSFCDSGIVIDFDDDCRSSHVRTRREIFFQNRQLLSTP